MYREGQLHSREEMPVFKTKKQIIVTFKIVLTSAPCASPNSEQQYSVLFYFKINTAKIVTNYITKNVLKCFMSG